MRQTWINGGPPGCQYAYSPTGWMTKATFEPWFKNTFVPVCRRKAPDSHHILLLDGHTSHISYNTVKCARENRISIVSIPSNNSHALQPLDVRVFNGVKDVFYKHVLDFYRDSGNATIDKDSFPPLLRHVWDGMKRTWIVHGFEKTGIYPYNRHAVDDKIVLNPKTLTFSQVTLGNSLTSP